MISNVKFNELEKRFDLLVEKVNVLEEKVRALTIVRAVKSLPV